MTDTVEKTFGTEAEKDDQADRATVNRAPRLEYSGMLPHDSKAEH